MAGSVVPGALRAVLYRVRDRPAGLGDDQQPAIGRVRLGPGQLHQDLQFEVLFAGDPVQPRDQFLVQRVRHHYRGARRLFPAPGRLETAQLRQCLRQHDQQLRRRAPGLRVHHSAGLQRQLHHHAQTGRDHSGLQPVLENRADHSLHLLPDSAGRAAALPGLRRLARRLA